jgi:hypothetical protein
VNQDANNREYKATFYNQDICYNQDMLQEMNDDRLDALRGMFRGKIISLQKESIRKNEKQITQLQIEYSYVFREIEIRQNRKQIHEEYAHKARGNRPSRPTRPGRPQRQARPPQRRS